MTLSDKKNDIHAKLMSHYPEDFEWWYYIILFVSFVLGLIYCYSSSLLPGYIMIAAIIVNFIMMIPTGVIVAVTNTIFVLGVPIDVLSSVILPGNPIGFLTLRAYTFSCQYQIIHVLISFKIAHYMKTFSVGSIYSPLLFGLLVGLVLPIISWFLWKKFPNIKWLAFIHFPMILVAASNVPPAPAGEYTTWFLVGFIFNLILYRYAHAWWEKAHVNLFVGFIIVIWILTPIIYYTNTWDSKKMPIISNRHFDINGNFYDPVKVLNKDLHLNETAYEIYGAIRMTAGQAIRHGFMFAAFSAAIMHTILYHVAGIVQYITAIYLLNHVPNICTHENPSWKCLYVETLYTSSIIWGAIGFVKTFGISSIYSPLLFGLLLGLVLPIISWFLWKKFPNIKWLAFIHVPIIFVTTNNIPPAPAGEYTTWFLVGFIFNFILYRYAHAWWEKYAYVFSAAMSCGVAICGFMIFFMLQNNNIEFPEWWGTGGPTRDGCPLEIANYSGFVLTN
ncbi:unnamed protein product [Rotaria sp. Silwood1]|nr:unnamed protein product [Rotaria sp. Silwood1]